MDALWFPLGVASAAAFLQPAYVPHNYEIVPTGGPRQPFSVTRFENISLLQNALEARDVRLENSEARTFALERQRVRLLCRERCPVQTGRRPLQDTVHWRDGRRTLGHVTLLHRSVAQNGVYAGDLMDVDRIELGSRPVAPALAASIRPTILWITEPMVNGRGGGSWGQAAFREPWLTLTEQSLIVPGRPPEPRAQVRFISRFERGGRRYADPPQAEDLVVWNDGSRSSGQVLISDGQVRQQGRPPRPFSDVRYIELAPTR